VESRPRGIPSKSSRVVFAGRVFPTELARMRCRQWQARAHRRPANATELHGRREEVPEGDGLGAGGVGLNVAGPAGDEGFAVAAFVDVALMPRRGPEALSKAAELEPSSWGPLSR